MNKVISDLLSLKPAELLVVVFTPAAGTVLSAAFFFGF